MEAWGERHFLKRTKIFREEKYRNEKSHSLIVIQNEQVNKQITFI